MKVMGKRMYLYLGAIFVMSVTFSMFSIMSSLLMKSVVDIAQVGEYQKLAGTIIVIVVVGVVSLLIYRIATIRYNVEAKRVYGVLSEAVLEVEMRLPYSYYEKHHSGEIISKILYDLAKMGDIYGSRLRRVVMPFIQVVVFLIPMFLLSWQLTLCLVGVNAIMMGIDEFKTQNHCYAKKSNKMILYSACLESGGKGFELLCSLVFLVVGIYFVEKGYTTLGALTAIYTMYGVFSFQFLQMGRYIPELVGCLVNAKNIFDFLDEAREPQNWYTDSFAKEKYIKKEFAITINSVTFSYDGENAVLQNFSLQVKSGECVAITGASGCGKTTLSKLLLGLYPLDGGTIIINGLDIKECHLTALRKQIAYVPQEPYLFNGSIEENIRMGRPDATEEEIIKAAKQANAHEFIIQLSQGYQTKVGERGNNLSGGQRQRIAIARAILKDSPIILMDEATSALDNESEQLVNDALKNLQRQKTIVMIAHRPSTIQLADRVCCMEEETSAYQ